jgi:hypothetical protein
MSPLFNCERHIVRVPLEGRYKPKQIKVVGSPVGRSGSDGFFYFLEYQGIDIDNLDVIKLLFDHVLDRPRYSGSRRSRTREDVAALACPVKNKQCTLHSQRFRHTPLCRLDNMEKLWRRFTTTNFRQGLIKYSLHRSGD